MSSTKELFNILDNIANSLDIVPTQYELAKQQYQTIGKWLAEGEYCLFGTGKKQCFKDGEIYPQGSIRLETTVKPIGQNEFDIDLVFYTPNVSHEDISPEYLKELIGNRLKENETYKKMLEPLNRGWRIKYADEFHLDITPSLEKMDEPHNDSELVPDRKLSRYMPSNPKGYAQWFDDISALIPRMNLTKAMFESRKLSIDMEDSATISDFPKHNPNKPLLKRFVQIYKRHRDKMFESKDDSPASIIITTLAAKSYQYCIQKFSYNNEFDLMVDTLKYMPVFIEAKDREYWIENPTVNNENFAEKWNDRLIKKYNFDTWHGECSKFFANFHPDMGQNKLFDALGEGFGEKPTQLIREEFIKRLDGNRKLGLVVAPLVGTASAKANTFFGK